MIPSSTKEDHEKIQKCFTSLNSITSDNFKPMLQVSKLFSFLESSEISLMLIKS